jgi:hypothetical protein
MSNSLHNFFQHYSVRQLWDGDLRDSHQLFSAQFHSSSSLHQMVTSHTTGNSLLRSEISKMESYLVLLDFFIV